jgi:hypothetical protein
VTNLSVRLLVLVGVIVLAIAALTRTDSADAGVQRTAVIEQIQDLRVETWRWQQLTMTPRTPTSYSERQARSTRYLSWVRSLWHRRAAAAERKAVSPPNRSQWLCIHHHERHPAQGWATRTGNGYYGGLQMDLTFQRTYGAHLLRRKGTADRWKPYEQIWVAERARRSGRGFYPWPNTARACGLI